MNYSEILCEKVLNDYEITREEALNLYSQPLEELAACANEIRKKFCAEKFDICTIINARSGKCSENCKFCAQSAHYKTGVEEYSLLSSEEIARKAKLDYAEGAAHYGIVTSGRTLNDEDVEKVCEAVRKIKAETGIAVCASLGLLNENQYKKLKKAGLVRVHNNLETSENYFPTVCTTHKFSDKVKAIKAAQSAGLEVCSGGIIGIGESIEDRIDMALSLRDLKIDSVPVNMLNPIKGTPLEANEKLTSDDLRRTIAVYRFILPRAYIRVAGGRGLLNDKGKGCFLSGANASISGDMLTTAGISIKTDIEMLEGLGFKVQYCND
ncbi:MAG: biotin synthase BioB [Synergistaceae bacterium]|nr:biotin synthase BioB [Synergistaceae bacterium]